MRKQGAFGKYIGLYWILAGLFSLMGVPTLAQGAKAAPTTENRIVATSPPYRIEWDGTKGTFHRDAFGQEPEQSLPLTFLHTDPGPTGHAQHLAWFLASDRDGFSLLWCYLNDTGRDFWCWLYRFPTNQLTTIQFKGEYRFTPPAEPVPPTNHLLRILRVPTYNGPDFRYKDWTRRLGSLSSLELKPTQNAENTPNNTKTLTGLRISPLHYVRVGTANGWRQDGWSELHALAQDGTFDPYYLILYSSTPKGFVIDLKRGQTWVADFGERVQFTGGADLNGAGAAEQVTIPEIRVHRFERYEVSLTSKQAHANPYTDVLLEADLRMPDSKIVRIPGYWDGASTWRLRFAPTSVGTWAWRTRSNDPELNGKIGLVECVSEGNDIKGFLRVLSGRTYPGQFGFQDGTPVFLASLFDPVHFSPAAQGSRLAGGDTQTPASFVAFQQRVEAASKAGFNHFVGGWLLDKTTFANKTQRNEGGTPFTDYDLDRLNPAYFQWMDRRMALCNEQGIVPNLGIGWLDETFFTRYEDGQLKRLWRYVLARYGAFDVCWNLFGRTSATLPIEVEAPVEEFAQLTERYDFYRHPLTTITPNPALTTETTAPDAKPKRSKIPALPPTTPFAESAWLKVITLAGGDLGGVSRNVRLTKPIMVLESVEGTKGEELRRRLWETRMRGGFWAFEGASDLSSEVNQWAAHCATFFRKTRFSRLLPRPDRLGGPAVTAFERRRRRQMEKARQETEKPTTDTPPAPAPEPPPTTVYLLADPGWEYVVYFPQGGSVTLDLLEATGDIKMTWFNPRTGAFGEETPLPGGGYRIFTAPDKNDWVLYLTRR